MSLSFGHNDLELNHIHNVKPLVVLPYYTQIVKEYQFFYRAIAYNSLLGPLDIKEHWPRIDIINNGWMEEKNTVLELVCHTFDVDNFHHLTDFTIQYMLKCSMKDGTIERPIIQEFKNMLQVNLIHFQNMKAANDVMLTTL